MDPLQAICSAKDIVTSMVNVVGALVQASRDIEEGPKNIQMLDDFVCQLEKLTDHLKQKHANKLHNPQLEKQIQALNGLVDKLRPNIRNAKTIVLKNRRKRVKVKNIFLNTIVGGGDPISNLVTTITDDLNKWLAFQEVADRIEKAIDLTAENTTARLRITTKKGYSVSNKSHLVRSLLEKDDSERVILIVGLSGMGKSCLARQVASSPPMKFNDGAVELGFGQWCSRGACSNNTEEYHKRLTRKISKLLVVIGFWEKYEDDGSGDLDYVCSKLQEALLSKNLLILLDDVWEQDIVSRFADLYDNGCKFLVTTRNEAVYEITEAEKVEICKEDVKETSKANLLFYSQLKEDELPSVADRLLECCGHHPLTIAVMGKALKKETRVEKWENAIRNLHTYAESEPGPISYATEKDDNTLTIFGSFEFSLEAMTVNPRKLFVALSALSWVESIPEACLEALWLVLGKESLFPLIVSKLVEGSLLMKADSSPLYQVHDMVSLYLDGKTNEAIDILITRSTQENVALIAPWLFVFGKERVKEIAEQNLKSFLNVSEENYAVIAINSVVQALAASNSISELEASRVRFSNLLRPRIADLISSGSPRLIAGCANAITNIFSKNDYVEHMRSFEIIGAVNNFAGVLGNCEDPLIQTNISIVLAKFAECGSSETVDKVLRSIPINQLANLLTPSGEECHESVFAILLSLMNSGQSKAIEKMLACGVDQALIRLLHNGSEVAQHHAIVTLKAFYELGGPLVKRSIRPSTLNLLPWDLRIKIEKYVSPDKNEASSSKPQKFDDPILKLLDRDQKQVLEAMQDIVPIIEKANEPRIRDMIIQGPLVERLAKLLQYGQSEGNSVRSQSAFLLMKLACTGGEPCVRKYLEYEIVPELVTMMLSNIDELQDAAYSALHQMLFGQGGQLVMNIILQRSFLDKFVYSIDSKSVKTRDICVNYVLDLVEVGNKVFIERVSYLQVAEKLAKLEKVSGGSGDFVVRFIKGLNKNKHLMKTERDVIKQQVARKVRAIMRGHKHNGQVIAAVEACIAEGSSRTR